MVIRLCGSYPTSAYWFISRLGSGKDAALRYSLALYRLLMHKEFALVHSDLIGEFPLNTQNLHRIEDSQCLPQ